MTPPEIKRYRISYEWWDMTVEFRDDGPTISKMKEMVEFWDGGEELLEELGDTVTAFMTFLGRQMLRLAVTSDNPVETLQSREGWYKLDGTDGIKVVSVDPWDFDEDEFQVVYAGTRVSA